MLGPCDYLVATITPSQNTNGHFNTSVFIGISYFIFHAAISEAIQGFQGDELWQVQSDHHVTKQSWPTDFRQTLLLWLLEQIDCRYTAHCVIDFCFPDTHFTYRDLTLEHVSVPAAPKSFSSTVSLWNALSVMCCLGVASFIPTRHWDHVLVVLSNEGLRYDKLHLFVCFSSIFFLIVIFCVWVKCLWLR